MATQKNEFEQIRDRLDLLAHLLCLLVDQNRLPSVSDQIALLATHGLAPAEIGRIVGREANYVSASMSKKKKGRTDAEER